MKRYYNLKEDKHCGKKDDTEKYEETITELKKKSSNQEK